MHASRDAIRMHATQTVLKIRGFPPKQDRFIIGKLQPWAKRLEFIREWVSRMETGSIDLRIWSETNYLNV